MLVCVFLECVRPTTYHVLRRRKSDDELVDTTRPGVHQGDRGIVELQFFGEKWNSHVLGQKTDHSENSDVSEVVVKK